MCFSILMEKECAVKLSTFNMPKGLVIKLVIGVVLDVQLCVILAVAVSALLVAVAVEAAARLAHDVLLDVAHVVILVRDHGKPKGFVQKCSNNFQIPTTTILTTASQGLQTLGFKYLYSGSV